MEPRNTGTGNTATEQNAQKAVTQPPNTSGTNAGTAGGTRGTTQETANFSPPGKQGHQSGGTNSSDGR
jgi:hypothetical protein